MDYDYNTSRKKLVLPEYGRHIQKMVLHAVALEDAEERNRAARAIITIMGNMNPHLRDVSDFKHKLWDHLAIISDFKLDIDSPYVTPTPETLAEKPRVVPYNTHKIRFKHYGRVIELLVAKAIEYGVDAAFVDVAHQYGLIAPDPELLKLVDMYAKMDGATEHKEKAAMLMDKLHS